MSASFSSARNKLGFAQTFLSMGSMALVQSRAAAKAAVGSGKRASSNNIGHRMTMLHVRSFIVIEQLRSTETFDNHTLDPGGRSSIALGADARNWHRTGAHEIFSSLSNHFHIMRESEWP
jgi:hypothetical protein